MAAELFDAYGRPAVHTAAADTSFGYGDDRFRLPRPNIARDIGTLLSRERHRALISDARYIRRAFPLVNGAVEQKADYVSSAGWMPVFDGEDEVWGDEAADFLAMALGNVDVRGPIWHWEKLWHLGCEALDVDGDFFMLLGESEDGWPQIQCLEAHRIGSRGSERMVQDGPYKGLRIQNGIVYNPFGREVAYLVLGDTPDRDRYISARDMVHVMNPAWFSDGRAAPAIAYSVLDWYDVKETREFERVKAKIHAAITLVESNEDGRPSTGAMQAAAAAKKGTTASGAKAGEPAVLNLEKGMVRYIRAGAGDLKAHVANTPSDQSQRFDERLVAGAFYGMGWRVEMMDLSKLSGGSVRGFADNINTTIAARHELLARFARRVALYVLAKLINRGDIPAHPEWMRWTIPPPPEFTPDPGRAGENDRKNIRCGLDSAPAAIRRLYGRGYRIVLREQARWIRDRNAVAAQTGVAPAELGTFALPGDATAAPVEAAPTPAADEA